MFPPPGWKVNVFNRDFQAYNYDTTLVTLEKWESSSYSSYTYTPWSFRFPAQTSRDLPGPNFRRIEISPLFFLEKLQSTVPHAKVFVEVKNFWSWRSKITLHQLHQKKKFLEKKNAKVRPLPPCRVASGVVANLQPGSWGWVGWRVQWTFYIDILPKKKYWKYSLITIMLGIICICMYVYIYI